MTTTLRANVAALLSALEPHIGAEVFDVVVDNEAVEQSKPDGACYESALDRLGMEAAETVAIRTTSAA